MNVPIIATSVTAIGTLEGAIPLALAVELSGTEWTPTVIGAAVVIVLGAATTSIVTVINALAAAEDRRQASEAREADKKAREAAEVAREKAEKANEIAVVKSDLIVEKTTEIHTAANSTLAKATAALELARMEFKGLQESTAATIDGLKREITVLNEARTAAVAATTPATVPPTVTHPESELASVKTTVEDTNKVVNEELKKP